MQLKNKVAVLAAIGFFILLVLGIFDYSFSLALAAEKKIKVRPVQRITPDAPRFVAGEVLARFRADLPEAALESLLRSNGTWALSVSRITGHRRIAVPPGIPEEVFLKHLEVAAGSGVGTTQPHRLCLCRPQRSRIRPAVALHCAAGGNQRGASLGNLYGA